MKVTKPLVSEIVLKLLEGISVRFANLEKSKTISLCMLFDPRYKHYIFLRQYISRNTKTLAVELVCSQIIKHSRTNISIETQGNLQPSIAQEKEVSI